MRSPYRPLPSSVCVGLAARPYRAGWRWWGGVSIGSSTRTPPGGWGGQPPPNHKGRAHSPPTTPQPLRYPHFVRIIYWHARTHATPPAALLFKFLFEIFYLLSFLECVCTKVLCSSSTIMGYVLASNRDIIVSKGGVDHGNISHSHSQAVVF